MTSALAVDGPRGPPLPTEFRLPERPQPSAREERRESPLPPEWSERTRELREAAEAIEEWLGEL
jgi:penicillin-binding protein 1A